MGRGCCTNLLKIPILQVSIYQLTKHSVGEVLPRLLEKIVLGGQRTLVVEKDPAALQVLDKVLWTYSTNAFLPHGCLGDGFEAEQPVLLAPHFVEANNPKVLVVLGLSKLEAFPGVERWVDMFDATDPQAVEEASKRAQFYKTQGWEQTRWRQGATGSWEAAP